MLNFNIGWELVFLSTNDSLKLHDHSPNKKQGNCALNTGRIMYKQVLKKYWGYDEFRPLQEDIIRSVADDGLDTLALLPTGGGKSLLFQVPAMAMDGLCLVITPLVALMKDQVENLKKRDIMALAIHSGMTKHEIDITLNNCVFGNFKFLYLSPERLMTEIFLARLPQLKLNLIAVDEAHCISQWGYDFRPPYLKIAEIRKAHPDVPVLALTATATPEVVEDIQEKLQFKKKNVFRKSFERKNISYLCRTVDDKDQYMLTIIRRMNNQTGIVYTRSRKKTKIIAELLVQNGISADYYHAGLGYDEKTRKQQAWKSGACKVIVSTNAFGMGIDKPDVRFVIHVDLPDSAEAYFQEAGRAGRDEQRAYAVLLYSHSDALKLERQIKDAFPEREAIRNVYHALGNFYQLPVGAGKGQSFEFSLYTFAGNYNFSLPVIHSSIKILEYCGYLVLTEEHDNPSRIIFNVNRNDLYKFQINNVQYDNFVKLLLRTYTGLFTDYVKIDENYLAQITNSTRQVIYNYLVALAKQKLITYIPQKRATLLVYTEERLEAKSVFLSPEAYTQRKEKYIEKVQTMLHYASETNRCRSQMLLEYFGEKDVKLCGECDYCKERKNTSAVNEAVKEIREEILDTVRNHQLSLNALVDSIQNHPPETAIKAVRSLLDDGWLKYNEDQEIILGKG